MELDELKRLLQSRFTDGLVTIVGSGMSASMGLPTMWTLGEHLRCEVPKRVTGKAAADWERVEEKLAAAIDLETALQDVPAGGKLVSAVVGITAELISDAEDCTIRKVLGGETDFAFRSLLGHLVFAEDSAHVITTNYDRLIEFAAETRGLSVDTGFPGSCFGRFDPKQTRNSLSTFVTSVKRSSSLKRVFRQHIRLHKPHGSIDWFLHDGTPVRCAVPLGSERLMITPGTSKYRKGYDSPFDYHRTAANKAVDSAAGFLIVGYGFNDDQLETHLRPQLAAGRPCLVLTKQLTPSAQRLVTTHKSVLALTEYEEKDERGTLCQFGGSNYHFPHQRLWNLSDFVRGVLE